MGLVLFCVCVCVCVSVCVRLCVCKEEETTIDVEWGRGGGSNRMKTVKIRQFELKATNTTKE